MKLSEVSVNDLDGGIEVLDIGASGQLSDYWSPLANWVKLTGFDPNAEECERLARQPSDLISRRFLPYAVTGATGPATLYKTKSIYCWSLLAPDQQWLDRFTFGELFVVEGTERIEGVALSEIEEIRGLRFDVVKCDSQGLELPILAAAGRIVDGAIAIETETGFVENYGNETTFDQLASFMRQRGFGLYDLDISHRMPRANCLADHSSGEQLLWAEALWMRDFKRLSPGELARFRRAGALKALLLHANHGSWSSGFEAAEIFAAAGLIGGEELDSLRDARAWKLPSRSKKQMLLKGLLQWVPRSLLRDLLSASSHTFGRNHPLRRDSR